MICSSINKDGTKCRFEGLIFGKCTKHYKMNLEDKRDGKNKTDNEVPMYEMPKRIYF